MQGQAKPLVSIIISAYNEEAILKKNLTTIVNHMQGLEDNYTWEMIIINDGSTDNSGDIADQFAQSRENVHVFHHIKNFGLGQAIQ